MNFKKYLCLLCAAVSAFSFASCSSADSSSTSAETDSESTSSDTKVDVYLSSDGTPYYVDEDGEKWMLFATQMDAEEEDATENYIYDTYDVDGISFNIPEGWFADAAYDYPVLFQQTDNEDDLSVEEAITIMSTEYLFPDVFDSLDTGENLKNTLTEDYLKEFFDDLLEDETYDSCEITEYGIMTVTGKECVYFDMTASYTISYDEDEEAETESFRSRYIIVPGINSQSIAISSLDTDDSFELVNDAFEEMQDSLVLPTDEETSEDDEE